ncbi:hypothetical protein BOTBODRAFT_35705 [Botryobasidium botryosum FD-172 SS1]|uniref:Thioredoxin domain-containing protein n=1 Tax=Botryobasidium botryosum (strain FD-172 SS1) TaxID=930990 RepID=A0A067MGY2_BOTB1|nr:hypothetical protein BOTBODRAFT_35705 [Botryobasidium botryosum FD-172 SS1]
MCITQIVSIDEFTNAVGSDDISVIGFTADWCDGPCKPILQVCDEYSSKNCKINFYQVDVDKQLEVAGSVGIMTIPTTIAYHAKGRKVGEVFGNNVGRLKLMLENLKKL